MLELPDSYYVKTKAYRYAFMYIVPPRFVPSGAFSVGKILQIYVKYGEMEEDLLKKVVISSSRYANISAVGV